MGLLDQLTLFSQVLQEEEFWNVMCSLMKIAFFKRWGGFESSCRENRSNYQVSSRGGAASPCMSSHPTGATGPSVHQSPLPTCEQIPPHPPQFLALYFSLLFFLLPFPSRVKKKNKPLNLKIHNSVGSCENIPAQRSPLLSERSLRSFFVGYPPFLPSTPPVHTEATFSASKSECPVLPPGPSSMGWVIVDAKQRT